MQAAALVVGLLLHLELQAERRQWPIRHAHVHEILHSIYRYHQANVGANVYAATRSLPARSAANWIDGEAQGSQHGVKQAIVLVAEAAASSTNELIEQHWHI
jgi:hypothetical protein